MKTKHWLLLATWAIEAFLKTHLETHQIGKKKEEADTEPYMSKTQNLKILNQ
jgi:hypothetical protein